MVGLLGRSLVVQVMVAVGIWTMPCSGSDDSGGRYLNSFAVQVEGGMQQAHHVARELGFVVDRELPNINVAVLTHPEVTHRSKRSADHHLSRLQSHPKVVHVQQEVELTRVKRKIVHDKQKELPIREIKDNSLYHREALSSISTRDYEDDIKFNDPYYDDMWYLKNRGQSGGERYLDMNIQVAWANGFSGEDVVVCILDDGVDHTHPDLAGNYDPKASADLNDKTDHKNDPMPNMTDPGNSHGTRCAGEIASTADNNVCGVGVAYSARIGGVRLLDGVITDSLEGEALTFNNDYIDIYSASWGPNDDGATMEAPGFYSRKALRTGVLEGRGGLGSIFVWATGNGGMNGDDCSADGYTSSIETLSVGSITDRGRQPYYMENCTSTLAVVPTGGEEYRGQESDLGQVKLKVITTDAGGGCIENFQGTSSAAPLAAGCLANVLQANPSLTWRDVQHIVVRSTRIPSTDSSWTINGGGHHVSPRFGFGLMDCGRMVHTAQDWKHVPDQHTCRYNRTQPQKLEFSGTISDSLYVDACKDDVGSRIERLEHVQVHLKMNTRRRGDTQIFLTSPSGTRSELLSPRPKDGHPGEWAFTFMTVHSWDEDPQGQWRLEVHDRPVQQGDSAESRLDKLMSLLDAASPESQGYLSYWTLVLYGTSGQRHGRAFSDKKVEAKAYKPSEKVQQRLKRDETESGRNVHVKRASLVMSRKNAEVEISDEDINKLAKRLNSFLKREEIHAHAKRILAEKPAAVSKKSRWNPYAKHKVRDFQERSHFADKENRLKVLLRSLEQLVERRRKKKSF